MKTIQEIRDAVAKVAKKYDAKYFWGTEDGITWLSMYGGDINPKIYDEITRDLSQETGIDCYFNKCMYNAIEIAMDAKMSGSVPEPYPVGKVEEYGVLFK